MPARVLGPGLAGVGPKDSPLVIVGEVTTKKDVQLRKPFSGTAGRLLDATLQSLGYARQQAYLTNVVKTRVIDDNGNDIQVPDSVIAQAVPELLEELRTLQPKVILAVGATASKILTGRKDKLGAYAGAMLWNEELGVHVIPTQSPGQVIMGNLGLYDDIFNAIQRAVRIAQGEMELPPPGGFQVPWELIGHDGEKVVREDSPKHYTWSGHFEATDEEAWRAKELFQRWIEHADAADAPIEFAIDTESRNTHYHDPMTMLQVYDPYENKAYAFTYGVLERIRQWVQWFFRHRRIRYILHNTAYDRQVLRYRFDADLEGRDEDTMTLALGLTEKMEQTSLKYLARQYLNAPFYEEKIKAYLPSQDSPFDQVPPTVLAEYGCTDTFYTYKLRDILRDLVKEEGTTTLCDTLLIEAQRCFADLEYHGSFIDMEYSETLEEQWVPIIEEAIAQVQEYATEQGFPARKEVVGAQTKPVPCPVCVKPDVVIQMTREVEDQKLWREWLNVKLDWTTTKAHYQEVRDRLQMDLVWPADSPNKPTDPSCKRCMKRRYVLVPDEQLNVRSSKQMQHLCFDMLKMRTGPNGKSCDKDFWSENEAHPLTKLVGAYRETDHLLRSYVRGTVDDVGPDGRIHPDFLLAGTVTGRLAIHNPPLQTLPKHQVDPVKAKMIRKLFKASPGHVIVDSDYSNLELFVAHHYSKDENLLRALTEQDFHRATASAIFQTAYDDVTSYQRFLSKFVTFGIAYGRQAYSLCKGELEEITGGSERKAQEFIDNFWGLYPQYAERYFGWQKEALETGEITTPLGRKRRWRLILPSHKQSIMNQAVNFPLQSLASDTCLDAAIRLNKRFKENDWGKVLFMVHDSVVCEVREEVKAEAIAMIKWEMEHPSYETTTPYMVNVEVGPNLGEVREWEFAA